MTHKAYMFTVWPFPVAGRTSPGVTSPGSQPSDGHYFLSVSLLRGLVPPLQGGRNRPTPCGAMGLLS